MVREYENDGRNVGEVLGDSVGGFIGGVGDVFAFWWNGLVLSVMA